ncbi:MAG TPA: transposase, partial [Chryseolinea sp.]|nr:transposase [Chryseolinea sp.]
MKEKEQFNLEEIKKKALEQFRSGKSLYGKDGAFAPMLKSFLEAALEGELDSHLDEDERKEGNRKNGRTSKTIQTSTGALEIETSRDRNATFEPELVKKRETVLADTLETKILGLYGLGMSFRDISSHLKEMYDADISHTTLSIITDRIIPIIKEMSSCSVEVCN